MYNIGLALLLLRGGKGVAFVLNLPPVGGKHVFINMIRKLTHQLSNLSFTHSLLQT